MANFFKNKLHRYLLLYFLLLVLYAVFSYSLTAPNLVLSDWPPYWSFQTWMWETFFNNRELLTYTYLGLISSIFTTYFLLVKNWPKNKPLSWWLPLLIAAPLLFSNNALSYDVFNYIFNAKMVSVYQANPHIETALNYSHDNWTRFMHNTHTPAPYFYGWTAFSLIPYFLGGGKFLPTLLVFKLFSFISLGLLSFSLVKSIKNKYTWLIWLLFNPLLLIEVVSNIHNDLWMMAPAIVGMMMISSKRSLHRIFISLILLLISASMKLATLALIPIWLAIIIPWKTLMPKLHKLVTNNWALFSSIALFLPLLTPRSKQFLPWYLIWSLAWVPLISKKYNLWKTSLIILSLSSMLRYLPYLWFGHYEDQVINQQLLITWIPWGLFWLAHPICQKLAKKSA